MAIPRRLIQASLALLVFVTPWAFAYGPLFPWSPVKPGYATMSLARADVFYPTGANFPKAYSQVDQFVAEAEAFHKLPMPRRLRIVACRDWSDFIRFSPLTPGRAVAGVTLNPGTVIYISPKIAERGFDTGEFLRHEIAHAAVMQNISFLNERRLRHHTWLYEGVPVWFARQRAFLTQDEFLAQARTMDLLPVLEFDANASHPAKIDMRFAYIAWSDFLDYLVQQRGRDLFDRFFRSAQLDPGQVNAMFERSYGAPFSVVVRNFQQAIQAGSYRPAA